MVVFYVLKLIFENCTQRKQKHQWFQINRDSVDKRRKNSVRIEIRIDLDVNELGVTYDWKCV